MRSARPQVSFTNDITRVVAEADVIIISAGMQPKKNGEADTCYHDGHKSTVPIGTYWRVAHVVWQVLARRNVLVASNHEFLRERTTLHDTLYPHRIVVGAEDPEAVEALRRLYRPALERTFAAPVLQGDQRTGCP